MNVIIEEYLENKITKSKLIRRLFFIRKEIKLLDGTYMIGKKRVISLILRGFTNEAIVRIAREWFHNWDNPKVHQRGFNNER